MVLGSLSWSRLGGGWDGETWNGSLFSSSVFQHFDVKLFLSPFSSVQFSRSVVSDSLRPHELQHLRPPFPSSSPGVHSDSCPSSLWCHPAISSSVVPFSSCPQSLPSSESFPMSPLGRTKLMCLHVKNPPAMQEMEETWFDPWVGKNPWRRAWQPTSVFLPRESLGQRSLAGYSP